MKLDPDHVRKLSRAITHPSEGGPHVKFDVKFMASVFERLSLWEKGLLTNALMRAGSAKRMTIEQRALLALFVHDGGETS